jgi:arsenate reductase (thioredoxin)
MRERPGFDYVINVCDESTREQCPNFPSRTQQLQWSFPNPAKFVGTHDQKLAEIRAMRDSMKQRIEAWCSETCAHQVG